MLKTRHLLTPFIVLVFAFSSCHSDKKQFDIFYTGQTGISFNPLVKRPNANDNEIKEFGNSVATGDLNNDGLPDLVFSGMYANPEVYLNNGGLQFENITKSAGIMAATNFNSYGVAIADVNDDGWNDIYICANGRCEGTDTSVPFHNLLYINQHNGTFKEQSANYHLNISTNSYMPYFFDFDKDDDLDLFLLVFPSFNYNPFDITYMQYARNNTFGAHSLLLENRNQTFVDVTLEKGIETMPATNNSCIVADINMDGWLDIYVANDFIFPDQLYINNHGHFRNELKGYITKTSMFGMGADCADINNDLYPDIIVADMLAPEHFRRKMNTLALSTSFYDILKEQSFPQYQRNCVQLNNCGANFSEISFIANTPSTEWSWSPLWADFDNDGFKDLFITSGSRKELTNLDHLSNFTNESGNYNPLRQWILDWNGIPSYSYHNFIFKNNNGYSFSEKTIDWGLEHTTNSEGAAYADFDKDGDIDIAVCNTNCSPFILRNNNNTLNPRQKYLRIKLHAARTHNYPVGTKLYLYTGNKTQYQEAINTRGYLSMSEDVIHFGVGAASKIDSLKICWPSGKMQTIKQISPDKVLDAFEKNAKDSLVPPINHVSSIIKTFTEPKHPYIHREDDFNDFRRDKIIPHKVSRQGPALAVADIDKDGDEDYFISGAKNQPGAIYLQMANGSFEHRNTFIDKTPPSDDETVAVWADLDGNGYPDLITGIGSNAAEASDTSTYHINTWFNKGELVFEKRYPLPPVKYPVGSISVADFDGDGDMDIFVGCRLVPGSYGISPESYLFENKGTYFVDITKQVPTLSHIGMVTCSAFADLDNDNRKELVVGGEFMPLSVFKKTAAGWVDYTLTSGLSHTNGLWTCLSIIDINNDTYPDILAGNWGANSIWRASEKEPLSLWVNDFDGNGSIDPVLFHYLEGVNAPFANRDLFCKQMPKFFNKFNNYESYARCNDQNTFDADIIKRTTILKANTLQTSLFINDGKGRFNLKELPPYFQMAPVNTFITYDFDNNGTIDLLPLGNTNSNFYDQGDIDALRGKIFSGDGNGNFDNGQIIPDMNKNYVVNSSAIIFNKQQNLHMIVTGVNNDTLRSYIISKPAR